MNALLKIFLWGDENRPQWLDYLRIALGAFLFIKSLDLMFSIGIIQTFPGGYDTAFGHYGILQTVIFTHMVIWCFCGCRITYPLGQCHTDPHFIRGHFPGQ